MTLTIEQFLKDAKPWLAQLNETGEPLLLISGQQAYEVRPSKPVSTAPQLRDLDSIPKTSSIAGDPQDIVHIDWSSQWRP